MSERDEFQCRSWLGNTLMDGVEEIIGRTGVYAIINLARLTDTGQLKLLGEKTKSPVYKDLVMIQRALEDMYGFRGGCGILMRAGRASFKHVLHQFGHSMGIVDPDFRMLQVPARLKTGLEAMARQFSYLMDTTVSIEDEDNKWLWRVIDCPFCFNRYADEGLCSFSVGILQEFLTWASGGRVYSVWEVECGAMGKFSCTLQIDKQPLD